MMGGGFGGCTISLIDKSFKNQFIDGALKEYYNMFSYPKKINKIINIFGIDQVKIVLMDDIITNPDEVMNSIFVFLGVNKIKQKYKIQFCPISQKRGFCIFL